MEPTDAEIQQAILHCPDTPRSARRLKGLVVIAAAIFGAGLGVGSAILSPQLFGPAPRGAMCLGDFQEYLDRSDPVPVPVPGPVPDPDSLPHEER